VISEEFNKQFAEARRAKIQLVADGSRESARPKVQRVRRLLEIVGLWPHVCTGFQSAETLWR